MVAAPAAGRAVVLSQPVTFVMGNVKKLEEVLPQLQGEPEEISKEKARLAAKEVNGPVPVEDTSLFQCAQGITRAVHGKIVPPRGPNDFGWDPIFQSDGYDQTTGGFKSIYATGFGLNSTSKTSSGEEDSSPYIQLSGTLSNRE